MRYLRAALAVIVVVPYLAARTAWEGLCMVWRESVR